eukprot:4399183-Prymnesium_polylepis.1
MLTDWQEARQFPKPNAPGSTVELRVVEATLHLAGGPQTEAAATAAASRPGGGAPAGGGEHKPHEPKAKLANALRRAMEDTEKK